MKLSKIEINGYGKWRHQIFECDKHFQVFKGLNESGKSTLRAFIEHILFGFPKKVAGTYPYEPMSGEAMGGRLWFEHPEYGELMVERLLSNGKIKFECVTKLGVVLTEKQWQDILSTMTLEHYVQVFGFNEHQLQQYQLISEEDLDAYLYSISVSGSDRYLMLAKQLKKESEKQFSPRASKKPINQQLKQLEEIGQKLNKSVEKNRLYETLQEELRNFQQDKANQEEKLDRETSIEKQLQKLMDTWEVYEDYQQKQLKLQEISSDKWHSNWNAEMENLHLQEEWLLKEIEKQEILLTEHQHANRTQPSVYQLPRWQKLTSNLSENKERIDHLVSELAEIQKQQEILSVELQLECDFWQVNPNELPPVLTDSQIDFLKNCLKEQEQLLKEEALLQQSLLDHQTKKKHVMSDLQDHVPVSNLQYLSNILMIAGVLLLVVALLVSPFMFQFLCLVLAIGAFFGSFKKRPRFASSDLKIYLSNEIVQLERKESEIITRLNAIHQRFNQLEKEQQEFYQQTLYAKTAVTIEHLLQGDPLANGRRMQLEKESLNDRQCQVKSLLEPYVLEWQWYFKQMNEDSLITYPQQWATIKKAIEQYKNYTHVTSEQFQTISHIQSLLLQLQQEYQTVRTSIQSLLEKSHVLTEEEFQNKALQIKKQEQLHSEVEQLERLLSDQLISYRHYSSLTELTDERYHQQEKMKMLTQNYRTLLSKIAHTKEQMTHLEKDGTVYELQTAFEIKKTEVTQALVTWASYQMAAQWLIDSLKALMPTRSEQILEDASCFLERLTLGRYNKVDFSNEIIYVSRYDWKRLTVTHLSRGTLDQVLVSLRLAFIKNLSHMISLPIMVDDGFVNFDSERKKIMLELLEELSQEVQVIYFTLDNESDKLQATVTELPHPRKKENK